MARRQRVELFLSNARNYSEGDCPETCRERRHRRIQMRRSRPRSAAHPETSSLSDSAHNLKPHFVDTEGEEEEEDFDTHPVGLSPPRIRNPMPVSSTISIKGGRMDCKLCVHEDFCRPEILGRQPLHFFAIYDGDASALYKELMHRFIAEELTRVDTMGESAGAGGSSGGYSSASSQRRVEDHMRTGLRRSFERMERVAIGACWCIENGYPCACNRICRLALESSAATVAILTAKLIVVAHCGVSRAVLCRGRIPIPLSHDHHKLLIPCYNGVQVHGSVEVSCHLGKQAVRSSVITTQPEISVTERRGEDECLILASDGVWQVMSNDTACNIATTCLRDGNSTDANSDVPRRDLNRFGYSISLSDHDEEVFPSKGSVDAAALLCRLALGRGSSDSMSVIVVDLKRQGKIRG